MWGKNKQKIFLFKRYRWNWIVHWLTQTEKKLMCNNNDNDNGNNQFPHTCKHTHTQMCCYSANNNLNIVQQISLLDFFFEKNFHLLIHYLFSFSLIQKLFFSFFSIENMSTKYISCYFFPLVSGSRLNMFLSDN